MSNIHIRGLDDQLMQQLKHTASHQKTSVNSLILETLRQGLGLSHTRRSVTYNDLDKFAGTWSSTESEEFMESILDFEQTDKTSWK